MFHDKKYLVPILLLVSRFDQIDRNVRSDSKPKSFL